MIKDASSLRHRIRGILHDENVFSELLDWGDNLRALPRTIDHFLLSAIAKSRRRRTTERALRKLEKQIKALPDAEKIYENVAGPFHAASYQYAEMKAELILREAFTSRFQGPLPLTLDEIWELFLSAHYAPESGDEDEVEELERNLLKRLQTVRSTSFFTVGFVNGLSSSQEHRVIWYTDHAQVDLLESPNLRTEAAKLDLPKQFFYSSLRCCIRGWMSKRAVKIAKSDCRRALRAAFWLAEDLQTKDWFRDLFEIQPRISRQYLESELAFVKRFLDAFFSPSSRDSKWSNRIRTATPTDL